MDDLEKMAEAAWNALPEFEGALKGDKIFSGSKSAYISAFLDGARAERERRMDDSLCISHSEAEALKMENARLREALEK